MGNDFQTSTHIKAKFYASDYNPELSETVVVGGSLYLLTIYFLLQRSRPMSPADAAFEHATLQFPNGSSRDIDLCKLV